VLAGRREELLRSGERLLATARERRPAASSASA